MENRQKTQNKPDSDTCLGRDWSQCTGPWTGPTIAMVGPTLFPAWENGTPNEAQSTSDGAKDDLKADELWTTSPTGLAATQVVIAVILIASNIFALVIIIRSDLARFIPSVFVIHLIVCDLYRGLVVFISSVYILHASDIRESLTACRVIGFFRLSSITMDSYAVPVLLYDRLLFVSSPVNYPFRMSNKLRGILIAFNVFQSVILAVIPFNGWGGYEYNPLFATCSLKWADHSGYPALVIVWTHFIPLVASVACFVKLVFWMRRRICQVRMKSSIKLTWSVMRDYNFRESSLPMQSIGKTLFIILVFYYLSWFPYFFFIILVTASIVLSEKAHVVYIILACLSLMTSVVNPWMYWMPSRKFRRNIKGLLPCSSVKTAYRETNVAYISPGRARSGSMFVLRDYPIDSTYGAVTRC